MVETLRLSAPSSRSAKAYRKFEDTFRSSLQVLLHPQNQMLFRLLDHKHIMARIVEYSVSENDNSFQRSQRTRIVTLREQALAYLPQNHAVHVYCPESIRAICIFNLILPITMIARPAAMNDRMYISTDWLQCRVSELHNLRPTSDTVLMLYYQFEGGIGSTKTDDEAWHHLMNCIRHDHSYIPTVHLRIDSGFWQLAHWRRGAKAVVNQKSLRNSKNPRNFPNFLEKVARIAAPADRWMSFREVYNAEVSGYEYEKTTDRNWRSDGTLLHITIDRTDTEDKQKFVHELAKRMQKLRRSRPLFWQYGECDKVTYARTEDELIEHGKNGQW